MPLVVTGIKNYHNQRHNHIAAKCSHAISFNNIQFLSSLRSWPAVWVRLSYLIPFSGSASFLHQKPLKLSSLQRTHNHSPAFLLLPSTYFFATTSLYSTASQFIRYRESQHPPCRRLLFCKIPLQRPCPPRWTHPTRQHLQVAETGPRATLRHRCQVLGHRQRISLQKTS